VIRELYNRLGSLSLGIWLMTGVIVLLAVGSFFGGGAESSSINDMPLFTWLKETPVASSWWLWLTIGLLAILALNTVLCSIESLRSKYGRANFLSLIAPQVMHLSFLFIVLAHLLSAYGGLKGVMQVNEGESIGFPDGTGVAIGNIAGQVGPMGMLTDYSAEVRYGTARGIARQTISPNHPFFYQGFGIYLKDVQLSPQQAALIEIHREPGAGFALAGALLFTVGNVVLLAVRRGR
jgi:hypothetical protein